MCYFRMILTMTGTLMLATLVYAGDEQGAKHDGVGKHGHGCRIVKCPQCRHDCVFSAEKSKETHTCYDVECKPICIPRVVFPWQKGCCTCGKGGKGGGKDGCCAIHNGVKKRSVRVQKKYEYECSHCKYQWSVDDKNGYKEGGLKDKMIAPDPMPADGMDVPPPPPVSAQRHPQQPPVRVVIR